MAVNKLASGPKYCSWSLCTAAVLGLQGGYVIAELLEQSLFPLIWMKAYE